MMDRKELIYGLGLVLKPLEDWLKQPDFQNRAKFADMRAQVAFGIGKYRVQTHQFLMHEGIPGRSFDHEYQKISGALSRLGNLLNSTDDVEQISAALNVCRRECLDTLGALPIGLEAKIYGTGTPFQVYCDLKKLFASATREIVVVDAWPSASLFSRYLSDVDPSVKVTILTQTPSSKSPRTSREFIEVSRVFAEERGTAGYRLLGQERTHDRYLKVDSSLYFLGNSIKDAARNYLCTFSPIPADAQGLTNFEALVTTATELFGESHPNHP